MLFFGLLIIYRAKRLRICSATAFLFLFGDSGHSAVITYTVLTLFTFWES